jgi:hypothetical protein
MEFRNCPAFLLAWIAEERLHTPTDLPITPND